MEETDDMERPVLLKEHFFNLYFLRGEGLLWHLGSHGGSIRVGQAERSEKETRLELLLGFAQGKIKRMGEFE